MKSRFFVVAALLLLAAAVAAVFLWPRREGVTVYYAVDDVHANPILDVFEQETGIYLVRKPDTEANKTVGHVNALYEERENPRCDVFWNNEILHTLRLARDGLLEPYDSPSAADIPEAFRDPERRWTGIAARARVLIVNTELVPEADRPSSMFDLTDERWKGRAAFVRPLTGTTLTHAAVLSTVMGEAPARAWFKALHDNGCLFPSGNGPLAKSVALGQAAFGFTDTDDYQKVLDEGRPVARVFPDQVPSGPEKTSEGIGTLLIPNTVALIKGGPQPELARKLVDFLLSKRVEEMLAHGDSRQIPVRGDVPRPRDVVGPPTYRVMQVDWDDVIENFDARLEQLNAMWRY